MNYNFCSFLIFIAKIVGRWWVFYAAPRRAEARSVVYNYWLQKGEDWKRLRESRPTKSKMDDASGWYLHSKDHPWIKGFIKYRAVTKRQYWWWLITVWIWLDDAANYDTTDKGLIESIVSGNRKNDLVGWLYADKLRHICFDAVAFGNYLDLGDLRSEDPFYNSVAAKVWNNRNTAMNLEYWLTDY